MIDVKAIIAQEKIRSELLGQLNAILGSDVTQSELIFPLNAVEREFLNRIKSQVGDIDISGEDFNAAAHEYIAYIEAKQEAAGLK